MQKVSDFLHKLIDLFQVDFIITIYLGAKKVPSRHLQSDTFREICQIVLLNQILNIIQVEKMKN